MHYCKTIKSFGFLIKVPHCMICFKTFSNTSNHHIITIINLWQSYKHIACFSILNTCTLWKHMWGTHKTWTQVLGSSLKLFSQKINDHFSIKFFLSTYHDHILFQNPFFFPKQSKYFLFKTFHLRNFIQLFKSIAFFQFI